MKHSILNCDMCQKIENIKRHKDNTFIVELSTGYVVLGDFQFYKGYTLFICKEHANELHDLPEKFRQKFLNELSIVAEAVYRAFKPQKLNYELLGNTVSHLHWHLFPRYKNDPLPQRPIWCIDSSITCAPNTRPTLKELHVLKAKIMHSYNKLKNKKTV